jgi:hypothetical protein
MTPHGLLLAASVLIAADAPRADEGPARVAQILIVGNTRTRPDVILRQLPLYPGAILDLKDLKAAEENLARLGRFRVDPEKGIRPTVTVIENNDSPFKDILVRVEERPRSAFSESLWSFARPHLDRAPWWLQLHWKFMALEFALDRLP